jgi:acetyl-CoA C-acetyltransferase
MKAVVIVAAKRTPQGRFLGAMAKHPAIDLALHAGREALRGLDSARIDQVILGNVLAAGQGMNLARQLEVGLGIPLDRTAFTVNMMCASGMQALILAAQAIRAGDAEVVLCGGTESMSNAPYLLDRARAGYKLGDGVLIDSVLRDGLTDTFSKTHMGLTAERLAELYKIGRTEQDAFALRSQHHYAMALARGAFADELVAVDEVKHDEHPHPETTLDKLSKLKPAFKPGGTVTAGNSSGINDGAAILVVADADVARKQGWPVLARIAGSATVGCDPALMGLGPVHATRRLCSTCGMQLDRFETIELNEAFAAQSLACIKELGVDPDRVNPDGGAVALGHPIGASGARLLVHLAHRLARGEVRTALATLCIGGGMGAAVALEAAQ